MVSSVLEGVERRDTFSIGHRGYAVHSLTAPSVSFPRAKRVGIKEIYRLPCPRFRGEEVCGSQLHSHEKEYDRLEACEDAYWGVRALLAEKSGYLGEEAGQDILTKLLDA